jgi:transposase
MAEKRHELSQLDRGRVLGAHAAGKSEREIGEMFGFKKSTVHDIIKAFKEEGRTAPRSRSGRPPKLNGRDKRHLVRNIKKNHATTLDEITAETNASASTVRRALHADGYFGRVAVRKPFVNETNRRIRLAWARERLTWKTEWDFIIWSDESKFELTRNRRRKWVWRRAEQRMDVKCLAPTIKGGDKSVMVWGCFTRFSVGPLVRLEGRLSAKDYIQVLEKNLIPYLAGLEDKGAFIFQDDNAPIHSAEKTKRWLAKKRIPCLPWPAQSPDLNPMEHLWDELDRRIRKQRKQPKTPDVLFNFLQVEWKRIPDGVLDRLVDSMPDRCNLVCEARGYPTRY